MTGRWAGTRGLREKEAGSFHFRSCSKRASYCWALISVACGRVRLEGEGGTCSSSKHG